MTDFKYMQKMFTMLSNSTVDRDTQYKELQSIKQQFTQMAAQI